jgi:hypothetical protein
VTSTTTDLDGQRADVELLITAEIRLAHTDGERVAVFLREWLEPLGLLPHAGSFPRGFLVELAPILRIASWQRAGLPADLEDTFPPAGELLEHLIRRFIADPMTFDFKMPAVPPRLCSRVVSTWIARCAWSSPSETGADVWLGEIDDDLLLDALADFLYEMRNVLPEDRSE